MLSLNQSVYKLIESFEPVWHLVYPAAVQIWENAFKKAIGSYSLLLLLALTFLQISSAISVVWQLSFLCFLCCGKS